MNHVSVTRRTLTLGLIGAAVLSTACEDKRIKELDTGITKDSALSVISVGLPPGSGPDSLPNVFTRERFLIAGKNYDVLYFTPNNEKAGKDSVPIRKLTPLVFVENKLAGRGWEYWDSVRTANKIPILDSLKNAGREAARKR